VGRLAVRGDRSAAGQQLAGVVEDDHAVAQQAPPLLGVAGNGAGGLAVSSVGWWARRPVWTHVHLWLWERTCSIEQVFGRSDTQTQHEPRRRLKNLAFRG
jgi:hypothetical protein